MPANKPENNDFNESAITMQPFVLLFVGVIAAMLVVIPLLPIGIPNLTFSFTSINGHAPKIYWYLSRSSGFIGLTALWVSMALGLSITNKLARLWPGAPTAFAIHEYASLLGLVFIAYHGLVLMGDSYTDFSLPKLLLPFSIAYRTTWIGMGQVSFYLWLIAAVSFYVRPWIGQKTWRILHYVNFATYVMGFLHSYKTGTDSVTVWAHVYFWISGASLVALLAYRIYDATLKNISIRELVTQRVQALPQLQISIDYKQSLTPKVTSVPHALLKEQAKGVASAAVKPNTPAITPAPAVAQVVNRLPVQTVKEDQMETVVAKKIELQTPKKHAPAPQVRVPATAPVMASAVSAPDHHTVSPNWVVKYEDDTPGGKINVRIFKEPTTRPIEELQKFIESKKVETNSLIRRLNKDFFAISVQPTSPNRKIRQLVASED